MERIMTPLYIPKQKTEFNSGKQTQEFSFLVPEIWYFSLKNNVEGRWTFKPTDLQLNMQFISPGNSCNVPRFT